MFSTNGILILSFMEIIWGNKWEPLVYIQNLVSTFIGSGGKCEQQHFSCRLSIDRLFIKN